MLRMFGTIVVLTMSKGCKCKGTGAPETRSNSSA